MSSLPSHYYVIVTYLNLQALRVVNSKAWIALRNFEGKSGLPSFRLFEHSAAAAPDEATANAVSTSQQSRHGTVGNIHRCIIWRADCVNVQ